MKTKEQKIEEINGQLTMLLNFVTYHEREQYKETSKDKPPTPNDANLVLLGFEEEATPYNSKHFELNENIIKQFIEEFNQLYMCHNDKDTLANRLNYIANDNLQSLKTPNKLNPWKYAVASGLVAATAAAFYSPESLAENIAQQSTNAINIVLKYVDSNTQIDANSARVLAFAPVIGGVIGAVGGFFGAIKRNKHLENQTGFSEQVDFAKGVESLTNKYSNKLYQAAQK
jgi:hypothetical protein